MIKLTLNDLLQKTGRSGYWLAQQSGAPQATIWKLTKNETQNSVSLPVLSKICATLGCEVEDILKFVPDAEDKALQALLKTKEKGAKKK